MPRIIGNTSKAHKLSRVREVARYLGEGHTREEACAYAEREWHVSRRTARSYLDDCFRIHLEHQSEEYLREHLAKHLMIRHKIVERAIAAEQFDAALRAAQDLAKLEGITPSSFTNGNEPEEVQAQVKFIIQQVEQHTA